MNSTVTVQKGIRDELRQMSLEEIQALKEELGLKVYNQALGLDPKGKLKRKEKRPKQLVFKRENKNRPREQSSKKTVARLRDVVSG